MDHFIRQMESLVFVLALLATAAFTTTALTVTADNNMVTVREGELLHLSCSISLGSEGIKDVRWYRDSDSAPYGNIDVTNCGVFLSPCPMVNTTDHRGVVQYDRGFINRATLTLVIEHSSLEDNTTFTCVVFKTISNTFLSSENIYVTVQHLPNSTYPMCLTLSDQSSPSVIHSLSCLAYKGWPVVSLEWTAMGRNSNQIPLSNQTEIVGVQVQNNLFLIETGISSNNLVFTCHMTSWAFPHVKRNCSIRPVRLSALTTSTGSSPPLETTTTPLTQSPTLTMPVFDGNSTVVLATTTSLFVVIVTILLVIIACLLSSRKRVLQQNVSVPSPGDGTAQRAETNDNQDSVPMYQNTSSPHAYENTPRNMGQQNEERPTNEPPPPDNTMATDYEPIQAGDGCSQRAEGLTGRQVQNDAAAPSNDSAYQALDMTSTTPSEYTTLSLPPN